MVLRKIILPLVLNHYSATTCRVIKRWQADFPFSVVFSTG
jgi:hypothetical protein